MFFAALPNRAVLSDVNSRLVETYQVVRDSPFDVIPILEGWKNEKGTYYRIRETEFHDASLRVAQFIYLNRTCWNGLYRVNKDGKFNVPFGNHGRDVFNAEHLLEVSKALHNTEILCTDFSATTSRAKTGDFVYLDPPYASINKRNIFRQYNEKLFSWSDQVRLGQIAVKLADVGCNVLVSNASTPSIVDLYPGFAYMEVSRHSILAANSRFRKSISELLIASRPNMLESLERNC